jgi:hypothetical protein
MEHPVTFASMPQLSHLFQKRLDELLGTVPEKLQNYSKPEIPGEIAGWLMSGANLLHAVVGQKLTHPYNSLASTANIFASSDQAYHVARTMLGVLRHLRADFEAGLISNIEAQVAAQTFDDLLDHAQEYLRQGRKEPAGVLTGVVFEDTVRKLCMHHNILEAGVKLDTLLSELVKKSVLLPIERNDGTTAASLRTAATHARWDQFDIENVKSVLDFTRRLIRDKLAAT